MEWRPKRNSNRQLSSKTFDCIDDREDWPLVVFVHRLPVATVAGDDDDDDGDDENVNVNDEVEEQTARSSKHLTDELTGTKGYDMSYLIWVERVNIHTW